jgi:branched-chain amino acid transport system substrate-binding protein
VSGALRSVRGRRAGLTVALLLALAATGVAGCGHHAHLEIPGDRIAGTRLTIYVSAPLDGASRYSGKSVLDGAELALTQAHDQIGRYRIVLKPLDDSTAKRGEWDPVQTTINAKLATADRTTIGYIGDYNSGASAVSIPLLNKLEIPQISPASTAVGLTSTAAGAAPGEPEKYYPTKIRTFARVVPNDDIQARAQVALQLQMGCTLTYVVDDGEVDGEDMADSFELVARSKGLDVAGIQAYQRGLASYAPFAASVAQSSPDCVLISGIPETGAIAVTRQIAAALPGARLFGTDGVAESSFTDPAEGGLPLALDSRLLITSPALGPDAAPPARKAFYAAYAKRSGLPQPSAIYGYEAMSLLLNAIERATDHGSRAAIRSKVRDAIFDTHDRRSVLGTYSITSDGDTTITSYGVYRVIDGDLQYWRTIDG